MRNKQARITKSNALGRELDASDLKPYPINVTLALLKESSFRDHVRARSRKVCYNCL